MSAHTLRTVAWTVAALTVLAVLGGLAVIYTGAYNVAATESHFGATRWALNTLQHKSVGDRAAAIGEPPRLDSAAMREA